MICKSCGQEIPDSAKFCGHCGARAEIKSAQPAKKFCTICGEKLDASEQFCHSCGTKVGGSDPLPPIPSEPHISKAKSGGKLLTSLKMVSMYIGEPTVGVAKSTGTLSVYDDRLEYKKQIGNALTLVGSIRAHVKIKEDPLIIMPLNQIVALRVGKYMGVYNTLAVSLCDGSTISFCPAVPASSEPQTIVALLSPYL